MLVALFGTSKGLRRILTVVILVPVFGCRFPFAFEKGVGKYHGMVKSHAMIERK